MDRLTILNKATSATLTPQDSGKVIVPTAPDLVFTLPAAESGLYFRFQNFSDDQHGAVVRPQAMDQIAFHYATLAPGKGVLMDWGFGSDMLVLYATGAGEPWQCAAGNIAATAEM